jgi:hypothetical protein
MKSIQLTILLTVSLLLIAFPVFGENPFPLDTPAINFQGRVEVDETGYTGLGTFGFTINWDGGSWSSSCITQVTEGVFNVILGVDTDDDLPANVFNHTGPYTLTVSFQGSGLNPDQSIVAVPLAINSDFLDGLDSPNSAFVGVTDVQTIYDKTLMDTHYFAFRPGDALPAGNNRGYFAWDSDNDQMVYNDGTKWVSWGEGSVTSPWTLTDTTISPKNAGDDVQLNLNENLIFEGWNGSATNLLIAIDNATKTGIYQAGNSQIDFATQSERRFSIRSGGQVRYIPVTEPGSGEEGDFYYDTDQHSFMYYYSGWHPIATGTGSIMDPIGKDCTLRGSDGTTWVATTGLLISEDGTATVQKNIIIKEKMYFYDDQTMYIQGPAQDTLDIYTDNNRALTIDNTGRLNVRTGGSEELPTFAIGSDPDTGIHHPGADTLAFSAGGDTKFKIRAGGQVHFAPRTEAPTIGAAELGDFYFDTGNDSFMYYSGGWKPIASGTGSIEEPDAVYDTVFATDGSTWWPNKELRINPDESWVGTKNDFKIGYDAGVYGKKLYWATNSTTYITVPEINKLAFFTSGTEALHIDASNNLVFNDRGGTPDARFEGTSDEYLLFLDGGEDAFAVGTNNVANYKATIQQTANEKALLVDQDDDDQIAVQIENAGSGQAIWVEQDGAGQSIWVNQDGNTGTDLDGTNGGAIHVDNRGNTGSAITAYSTVNPTAPLLWLKTGSAFDGEPLIRIESYDGAGETAAHMHLVPISNIDNAFSSETGAIYMNVNGNLYYNNGTDWIALTGAGGGDTGTFATQSLDNLSNVAINEDLLPGTGLTIDLGSTTDEFEDLWIDGTANLDTVIGGDATFTTITATTVYLGAGAAITEFSTDTTLAGGDVEVPTEQAVKEYVDEAVAGVAGVAGSDTEIQFNDGGEFGADSAFTWNTANDKLTVASEATTTNAVEITANSLTSGTALDVSSNADGATDDYDLVHFSAQTGRALVIEQAGGGGGAGNEAVSITRTSDGRALTVTAANTSQQTVYIGSSTATSGNILLVSGTSAGLTSGAVIKATQSQSGAAGNVIYVEQDGTGKGISSKVVAGDGNGANAIWVNQDDESDSGITNLQGGAVHIINSGNPYGGLTVYSDNNADQAAPLATIKTNAAAFDQALFAIDPVISGNGPHIYLKPIDEPTPQTVANGMIYMGRDGYLYYYNGAWIALTGVVTPAGGELPAGSNDGDLLRWEDTGSSWEAADSINLSDTGTFTIDTADINGGTIDSTTINASTIGLTTPAAGEFTSLTANTVALNTDGSAAAPAVSINDSLGLGIFRAADNILGFATNGVEKLRIYSTAGGSAANPLLQLSGDANTGIFHPAAEAIAISGDGTETIRFDADNYVGIGTAGDIDSKLHIETSGVNALKVEQGGAFEGIFVDQNGADSAIRIDQEGDTRLTVPTDTLGGSLHVGNTGNIGLGISAFSDNTLQNSRTPLAWLAGGTSFGDTQSDMAILRIQANSRSAAHLELEPIAFPPVNPSDGMIYFDTDGYLYVYDGAWIALTGDSGGGAGDWATQSLDNLSAVAINSDLLPQADNTIDLGSDAESFAYLWIDSTATLATVDIGAGAIDGTAIGQTAQADAHFNALTADNINLNAGVTIVEFSTDTTLAGGDDEVPTELAVKTYVDDAVTGADFATQSLDNLSAVAINSDLLPQADNTIDLGSEAESFAYLWIDSTATLATVDIGAGAIDGTAIGQASATLGKFSDLTATGDVMFDDPTFFVDASESGVGIGTAPDNAMLKVYSNTGGEYALFVEQDQANRGVLIQQDGAADALYIDQNGNGNAIEISQDALADTIVVAIDNDGDKNAIKIDQDGDIAEASLDGSNFPGTIHIDNSGNSSSAISVYCQKAASVAPLVWLKTGSYYDDQPLLRIEPDDDEAAHLHLVPTTEPDSAFDAMTGAIYADVTGSLYYNNGSGWGAVDSGGDLPEVMEVVKFHTDYKNGDVMVQSSIPLAIDHSSKPYENAIAGVAYDGKIKLSYDLPHNDYRIVVAFIGLAGCKVTNEGGPIMPGDKLVTSSTQGYAMKADLTKLKGWQIIGTAREPFDGEEGMIEIMVGK